MKKRKVKPKKDRKTQYVIIRVTQTEKNGIIREASKNMRSVTKHIRMLLGIYQSRYADNNVIRESALKEKLKNPIVPRKPANAITFIKT